MKVRMNKTQVKEIKKYAKDKKIPMLNVVYFFPKREDYNVVATNLEKWIALKVDIENPDTDWFNLPEKAMNLLEKEEEVEISVKKKVSLKGRKFRVSFAQVPKEEVEGFEFIQPLPERRVRVDKEKFITAIKKIEKFRGKEIETNSFFMVINGNTFEIFATDKATMGFAKLELDGEVEEELEIVVDGSFKDVVDSGKALFSDFELGFGNNKVFLIGDSGYGCVSVKEIPFLNYQILKEKEFKNMALVDKDELKDAIEDVKLVYDDAVFLKEVKIIGKDGEIRLYAEGETGSAEVVVDGETKEDFEVKLNAEHLERILKVVEKDDINLEIADGVLRIVEEGFEYYAVLLR